MMRTKAGLVLLGFFLLIGTFALSIAHRQQGRASAHVPLYFVDPMHPTYRSSKPGIAPDCGMKLIPVYAEDLNTDRTALQIPADPVVTIGAGSRALYGIKVAFAEVGSATAKLHVYGRVAADETRTYQVELGTDGYVKETSGDAPGAFVRKNQHLALVYSPEFLSVAGGYLSANERTPGQPVKEPNSAPINASAAQARADRLRNLGMSDVQIEEISESRKIPEDVYVVSPTDGYILTRNIAPGMRFEKHSEFYRIADLSHVWILAEGLGQNASMLQPGASAEIVNPDTGERFKARVSDILPAVDPTTGALTPRLEVSNPGLRLKPGMFVDIYVAPTSRTALTVPAEAIVDTGTAKHVFVEVSENNFRLREVETGQSEGGRVEILHGLNNGDAVVASGTFLVDSEARLHATPASAGH
jgi:Cu(I)/Ag(I) efflux system membrane fusion protein